MGDRRTGRNEKGLKRSRRHREEGGKQVKLRKEGMKKDK
jgi:hypothetical protein